MQIIKPIKKNLCIGDVEHNKLCAELIKAIPVKYQPEIFSIIEKQCNDLDIRWIQMFFSKTEIKKICAWLKSKTKTTFEKRYKNLQFYFSRTIWTTILNKEKFEVISEIHDKICLNFKNN